MHMYCKCVYEIFMYTIRVYTHIDYVCIFEYVNSGYIHAHVDIMHKGLACGLRAGVLDGCFKDPPAIENYQRL